MTVSPEVGFKIVVPKVEFNINASSTFYDSCPILAHPFGVHYLPSSP